MLAVEEPDLRVYAVGRAYDAAVAHGDYLWHEFGDSTFFRCAPRR